MLLRRNIAYAFNNFRWYHCENEILKDKAAAASLAESSSERERCLVFAVPTKIRMYYMQEYARI